ncbi:hypothetical protein HBI56_095020 [Parastagonospora nodorum]|nr:hypothetical protein HBH53_142050 [Parastagonospora nodorum]KAH3998360.1 hypothetical protein HBI10_131200 [Parastagonospora nodorum]KAH4030064.1 hypothetical protein HBI13_036400 [Parastagonospora nodorum]KAH4076482.1 hypothetical protein HBH50_006330 [Parastagonospora nodorum]KAH4214956.1 hypothetical protein HBI95_015120 [Parastagonospora nodorum]
MKFLNTAIVVTALVFAMTVQAHCPPEVCNHLKKRTFPWHKNIVESFEANETEVAKIRCRGVYATKMKLLLTVMIIAVALGVITEAKCPPHVSCPWPLKSCQGEGCSGSAQDKRFQFIYDSEAAKVKTVEDTEE